MTIKRKTAGTFPLICLLTLMASVMGCIKEDLSECTTEYTFTVKAYGSSGELSASEVADVMLFVFNGSSLCFTEHIETQVGESVTISIPDDDGIHIVGWGNLGGGSQQCAIPRMGDSKDVCCVDLLPHTRATTYALAPDDLFRGELTVLPAEGTGEKVIPVHRVVGSMTVTVRNLPPSSPGGSGEEDYLVVIHETSSSIDFYGNLSGDKVGYRPGGAFVGNAGGQKYYVAPFNLFPDTDGMRIEVFQGQQLLASVTHDNTGNPVVVERDKLTNVLIDLIGTVSVRLSINQWGEEQVWKEF